MYCVAAMCQVSLVRLASLVLRASQAPLDRWELEVLLETLETVDQLDHRELKDSPEIPDLLVQVDRLDSQARMELLDHLDQRDRGVNPDHKDLLEPLVLYTLYIIDLIWF